MSELTGVELRAWQGLLHAHQQVTRVLDEELRAEHRLSLAEYDVLLRLARAPKRSLRMSELAERVLMSASGLTRVVDRLSRDGLVDRRPFADDGRVTLAALTEEGRTILRAAARTHIRGIRRHFTAKLTRAQLEAVAGALEAITGAHAPH